nr:ATP-binding protein [Bifidobacterium pseudocatenulatum]
MVDNTHDSSIMQVGDAFASTKHGGEGLGTATVRETAERHHGATSFDYDGTLFHASVMLCLDD